MQKITKYLFEKFKLSSDSNKLKPTITPKTTKELRNIIEKEIKESKYANLNFIDTSYIKDMSSLFDNLNVEGILIDSWDTSNVENMDYMFWENSKFNCDISEWNVKKVKSMRHMFDGCTSFDCDISKWEVDSLEKCRGIFDGCTSLKKIPEWSQSF